MRWSNVALLTAATGFCVSKFPDMRITLTLSAKIIVISNWSASEFSLSGSVDFQKST